MSDLTAKTEEKSKYMNAMTQMNSAMMQTMKNVMEQQAMQAEQMTQLMSQMSTAGKVGTQITGAPITPVRDPTKAKVKFHHCKWGVHEPDSCWTLEKNKSKRPANWRGKD